MRRLSTLVIAAVAVATAACGDSTTAPDISATTFAPSLNVDLGSMTKTASGLYYKGSIVGSGATAQAGRTVTVNYTGWLTNGTRFDSGQIPNLPLGAGAVIPGWDEGLVGMKVCGWRKLVIPPALGHGSSGSGPIPGNAVLIFNVQLVAAN